MITRYGFKEGVVPYIPENPDGIWVLYNEHKKEFDRLTEENEELKSYKEAIDDALIVANLGIAQGNPRKELNQLICWERDVHEYFEMDKLTAENARLRGALERITNDSADINHELRLMARKELREIAREALEGK